MIDLTRVHLCLGIKLQRTVSAVFRKRKRSRVGSKESLWND